MIFKKENVEVKNAQDNKNANGAYAAHSQNAGKNAKSSGMQSKSHNVAGKNLNKEDRE